MYCKKLERATFKDPINIKLLNEDFYAIKFDTESADSARFKQKIYKNTDLNQYRNPVHDIAKSLTVKSSKNFTLPALIILNADYQVLERYFTYLSPKELRDILRHWLRHLLNSSNDLFPLSTLWKTRWTLWLNKDAFITTKHSKKALSAQKKLKN